MSNPNPPIAINDTGFITNEATTLTISASSLLANDTDPDGDSLTITSVQNAEHGSASLDANGNVVFTPAANFIGEANFEYTVSDGQGGFDTATVSIVVKRVSDVVLIEGTDGSETLHGTSTDDAINGKNGDDTLFGYEGDDLLVGSDGSDWLYGDGGHDTLDGGSGNDQIYSGAGDDVLRGGAGNDYFQLGQGWDVIDGGEGSDILAYYHATGGVTIDFTAGQVTKADGSIDNFSRIETVYTLDGDDVVIGDGLDNALWGRGGNDIFTGGGGNDYFYAGEGSDTFDGGSGADTVDYYNTPSGAVTVNLVTGQATKADGTTDTLSNVENIVGSNFDDMLYGSIGDNSIWGGSGNDQIYGQDGDDVLSGGAGNDYFQLGQGWDVIDGGEGSDILAYYHAAGGVTIDFTAGRVTKADGSIDNFSRIETVYTLDGDDVVIGDGLDNALWSRGGNDTFTSGGGNDYFYAGEGSDTFDGGSGADTVDYYNTPSGAVMVNLVTGQATKADGTTDTLSNVENIVGSNFDDTLYGSIGDNSIWGGSGNDQLYGQDGNDLIYAGLGADLVDGGGGFDYVDYSHAQGGGVIVNLALSQAIEADGSIDTLTGIENVKGSQGDDNLTGDMSGNSLYGGDGSDIFRGNAGNDLYYGEGGNDYFFADQGSDGVDGGAGIDNISYIFSLTGSVTVNLTTGQAYEADGSVDTISSIENITGSRYNDSLIGNSSANLIWGFLGNDIIDAGTGDDYIYAGLGSDIIDGGVGNDTIDYFHATGAVSVDLVTGQATEGGGDIDTLTGIESILGSAYADTISGDSANNSIYGSQSNDTLSGRGGSDTYMFYRGDGQDTVHNDDTDQESVDRLTFDATVENDHLWFARANDNLVVSILGTTDSVTFANWYADDSDKIDEFIAGDGSALLANEVDLLVSAMAAFSPSTGPGSPGVQPDELPSTVQIAVDATWE